MIVKELHVANSHLQINSDLNRKYVIFSKYRDGNPVYTILLYEGAIWSLVKWLHDPRGVLRIIDPENKNNDKIGGLKFECFNPTDIIRPTTLRIVRVREVNPNQGSTVVFSEFKDACMDEYQKFCGF